MVMLIEHKYVKMMKRTKIMLITLKNPEDHAILNSYFAQKGFRFSKIDFSECPAGLPTDIEKAWHILKDIRSTHDKYCGIRVQK